MRKTTKRSGDKFAQDIKRATRKPYSRVGKIKNLLDGLRGEDCVTELCRREGICCRVCNDIIVRV